MFSEGIDLVGTRLVGTVIVGVGLPGLCGERDLIRDFYDTRHGGNGYLYAYAYPGFNRVMQAAGRVIRSETDRRLRHSRDDRFARRFYYRYVSPEWQGSLVFRRDEESKKKFSFFRQNSAMNKNPHMREREALKVCKKT